MFGNRYVVLLRSNRIYLCDGKFLTLKNKTIYDLYKNKELSFDEMFFDLVYVETTKEYLINYGSYGKLSIYDRLSESEKMTFQNYFLTPKNFLFYKHNKEIQERLKKFRYYSEVMLTYYNPNFYGINIGEETEEQNQVLEMLTSQ
jgi:hypothetical protein